MERIAHQPFGVFVFQPTPAEKAKLSWKIHNLSKVIPNKLLGKPDECLTMREYSLDHSIALPNGTEAVVIELAPKEKLKIQLERLFGKV